jgi:CheY-like chemotaxis protein
LKWFFAVRSCKRLVELMGGNISVESEAGVGTTVHFSMTFGLPMDEHAAGHGDALVGNTGVMRGLRVLLAEDDNVSGIAYTKFLQGAGATMKVVLDGQQALGSLRQEHFDLVLMDIQMPVMDGMEATRAIRSGDVGEEKKNIPIIALTAYAMSGDREKFLAAGMNGYVAKPVDKDALIRVIIEVMKRTQRR